MNDLTTNIAAFFTLLRTEHGFAIGHAEAHDALFAVETLGVTDQSRVRSALRLVCCGSREDVAAFDRAFDGFFFAPERGIEQPAYQPRHTRPGHEKPPENRERRSDGRKRDAEPGDDGAGETALERRPLDDSGDDATAWQAMRARYSPIASHAEPPEIEAGDCAAMLRAANRLIESVRRGRSRRWKAAERGGRFDLRRTIRASLQTGGDPIDMRTLGHPPRNPRFVVLVDGSRSMTEHSHAIVQFSRALARRSARTNIFFFSTELRDVTHALRHVPRGGGRLSDLGEAWGGGTKIGANLASFVRSHGRRLLTAETVVIVFSDGLDVGAVDQLEGALATIDQRAAALVWLNPHAAVRGYAPTARGMRAALPFVTLLASANDAAGFEALARKLSRNTAIRGRRR